MSGRKPKFGKKSWVEQWPEETRRFILWLTVAVFGLIIVVFWLINFQNIIPSVGNRPAADDLEQLQDNLRLLINATTENINLLDQNLVPAEGNAVRPVTP